MQRSIAPVFDKDRRQHRTEPGIRPRQEKVTRRGPITLYSLPQQHQRQQHQQHQQQENQQYHQYQQQPSALTQVQPPTPLPLPQYGVDTQQSPKSTPPMIPTEQRQIVSKDRQGVGPTVSNGMEHLP